MQEFLANESVLRVERNITSGKISILEGDLVTQPRAEMRLRKSCSQLEVEVPGLRSKWEASKSRAFANNADRVSAQEAFKNLQKKISLDRALAVVEIRLLALHEARIGELDISLTISHFRPRRGSVRDYLVFLHLTCRGLALNWTRKAWTMRRDRGSG